MPEPSQSVSSLPGAPFPDEAGFEQQSELAEQRGGQAYGELIAAQRLLQDRLAGAVLSAEVSTAMTHTLNELSALLAEHQVPEMFGPDGAVVADCEGLFLRLLPGQP